MEYAEICEQWVSDYLADYDCKAAAFFMGAVAHYIADATFAPHLEDGISTGHEVSMKYGMLTLTSRKWSDRMYSDGAKTTQLPFISIEGTGGAKAEYSNNVPALSAFEATWYAGYDTFFGKPISRPGAGKPYPSNDHIQPDFYCDVYPEFPKSHFDLNDPEKRNDYWSPSEIGRGDVYDYMWGMSCAINVAVYYTAAFLTHVKDWYVKCHQDVEDALSQVIYNMAFEYAFMWMMVLTGNAMALLGLVSVMTEKPTNLIQEVLQQKV